MCTNLPQASEAESLKLTLASLEERAGLSELIIKIMPAPLIVTDNEGLVVIWNAAAERLFGWVAAEAIGHLPPLVGEEHMDEFRTLVSRVMKGESVLNFQTTRRKRSGAKVHLEMNLTPLRNPAGQSIGVIAMMLDITEKKRAQEALWQSEHRFAAFMEHLPVSAWMKSADGHYVYANHALRKSPGYEDCLGKTDADILPAILADNCRTRDLEAMSDRIAFQATEPYVRGADWREQLVIRFPILSPKQEAMLVAGVSLDITEQRQAEIRLQKASDRMLTLSRRLLDAREAEVRHIARELHDGIGQSLAVAKFEIQAARSLASTSQAALRLDDSLALIDDLIKSVRTLTLDLRPPLLDEFGLVPALTEFLNAKSVRAGFSSRLETTGLDQRIDHKIEIACFRVAQEAITNVVRHASAKMVLVELERHEEELRLLVRDDGGGFDTFSVSSDPESGFGFGLLSMRERVELCDGRFSCESRHGHGTDIRAVFSLNQSPQ